jgi:hypothetical protein
MKVAVLALILLALVFVGRASFETGTEGVSVTVYHQVTAFLGQRLRRRQNLPLRDRKVTHGMTRSGRIGMGAPAGRKMADELEVHPLFVRIGERATVMNGDAGGIELRRVSPGGRG